MNVTILVSLEHRIGAAMNKYFILYAWHVSYYSGKVRSYLSHTGFVAGVSRHFC